MPSIRPLNWGQMANLTGFKPNSARIIPHLKHGLSIARVSMTVV